METSDLKKQQFLGDKQRAACVDVYRDLSIPVRIILLSKEG